MGCAIVERPAAAGPQVQSADIDADGVARVAAFDGVSCRVAMSRTPTGMGARSRHPVILACRSILPVVRGLPHRPRTARLPNGAGS